MDSFDFEGVGILNLPAGKYDTVIQYINLGALAQF